MAATRGNPFVGRSGLLDLLDDELVAAAHGKLGIVLLLGEGGMGKTRLAAELLSRHPNVIALSGRSYSLGGADSLGLWIDAIESYLRTLRPSDVVQLCGSVRDELAAVLPSVGAITGTALADPPRARVLRGIAELLGNIARRAPVVIVLDDVHLADGSSWAALGYLARHQSDAPILIVLAARPVELGEDPSASDVVLALEQEGFLRTVPVLSMNHDELAALAATVLDHPAPEPLVSWLTERSRGLPLFAHGLLRALIDEGGDLNEPALRSLPEDLAARVEARLRQLDGAERSTLELIAVVGAPVEVDDLVSLSGRAHEDVLDTLDRLTRLRFLNESERAGTVSVEIFHPLIQEAIYSSVGVARRRALHRFVARTLMSSGRLGSAAGHYVRSAGQGDKEAIDALQGALRQAETRQHHREALALVDALLDILPAGDARWLDVFDSMTWQAEWVVDHRADMGISTALRAMRRIDQLLAGSADTKRRATAKYHLGTFLVWGSEDVAGGQQLLREAMELYASAGDHQAVLLVANEIGYATAIAGDTAGLVVGSADVLARARQSDDRFAEMQALCSTAHGLLWGGAPADAAPVLSRALTLAREDHRLYRVSYLLGHTAFERGLNGDMSTAHQLLIEGREANASFLDTALPDFAAFTEWLCGRLTDGLANGRELIAWDGGLSRRRVFGACFAAFCAIELGATEEAARIARTSAASFDPGLDWWCHSKFPDWMEATLLAADGRHAEAIELLAAAARYMDRVGTHLWSPFIVVDLADSAAAANLPEPLATALADAAWPTVPPAPHGQIGLARFCSGALEVAASRPQAAIGDLTEAAAVLEDAGWMMLAGRARALLGRALLPSDRTAAHDQLSAAASIFQTCGAERRYAAAIAAIDASGGGRRRERGEVAGLASLTAREREVAQLASAGASTREIASKLFIGERTVETHLSKTYAKLGLRGRTDLARVHRELEAAPNP